jgi:hypothetical protein
MSIVATLKVNYCRYLTLGSSIGDTINPVLRKSVVPLLEKVIPDGYHNWIPVVLNNMVKFTLVKLAFTQHRLLSCYHSASRGGLMFSRSLLEYLSHMRVITINHEETIIDEIVGYGLAYTGMLFQLKYAMTVPYPLNLFLFPFVLIEGYLTANIAGAI